MMTISTAPGLPQGLHRGYDFLFAEQAVALLAYTGFGPISGTTISDGWYGIAVRRTKGGRNVNRRGLHGEAV